MIQTLTLDEIYRVFQKTYPLDKLAFTQFRLHKPPVLPRSSGRRAAVVSAPLPKRYKMPKEIDDMIRARCW
jgi:hypothetical protein